MKKKCTSTFEIKVNNINIGFAVNAYHYSDNNYSLDSITTEFIPYSVIENINGIQLNPNRITYVDKTLRSSNQDETQTRDLLNNMILNNSDFDIRINEQRRVFNLIFKLKENVFKYLLIHEYCFEKYKQVQILPENEIIKFDISVLDSDIITKIESLITEKENLKIQ